MPLAEATAILADLIAFESLPGRPNGAIAGYVADRLRDAGATVDVLPGPEGDRVNLLGTIGPRDRPGFVLSSHMDVVPADRGTWTGDPFRLAERDGRLYGRGTSDMKGFLAAILAAAPLFSAAGLTRPVHFALSYDEEIGCRGAPHLIAALPDLIAPPAGCIVGEPSEMAPVLAHKGKVALEIVLGGRPAHSSDPDLGINALYALADLVRLTEAEARRIAAEGRRDERFHPAHSTLVAGVADAGTAVNVIPARARLEVEVRTVPGEEADGLLAPLLARADALVAAGRATASTVRELARYPALPPEAVALGDLVSAWTGRPAVTAVSYGTEAGLYHAAGIPTVICGPGSITRAHRPDEYIEPGELAACLAMLDGLARHLAQ